MYKNNPKERSSRVAVAIRERMNSQKPHERVARNAHYRNHSLIRGDGRNCRCKRPVDRLNSLGYS